MGNGHQRFCRNVILYKITVHCTQLGSKVPANACICLPLFKMYSCRLHVFGSWRHCARHPPCRLTTAPRWSVRKPTVEKAGPGFTASIFNFRRYRCSLVVIKSSLVADRSALCTSVFRVVLSAVIAV